MNRRGRTWLSCVLALLALAAGLSVYSEQGRARVTEDADWEAGQFAGASSELRDSAEATSASARPTVGEPPVRSAREGQVSGYVKRRWTIVSEHRGQAVRAAFVSLRAAAQERAASDRSEAWSASGRTDARGQLTLLVPKHLVAVPEGAEAACELEIRAERHVGVHVRVTLLPDAARIILARAAQVEVSVQDPSGAGVEGARVCLLPPVLAGAPFAAAWGRDLLAALARTSEAARAPRADWVRDGDAWRASVRSFTLGARELMPQLHAMRASDWVRKSDAEGRVIFDGVAPSEGWRAASVDGLPVKIEPAHEAQHLESMPTGVRVADGPVAGVSGLFDVGRAVAATVRVVQSKRASILGVFEATQRSRSVLPQVKLYRVVRARSGDGKEVVSLRQCAFTVADAAGRFAFRNVASGEYVVRSWWRVGESEIYFTSSGLRLLAEDVDLGSVRALRGHRVALRLGVQDRRGEELQVHDLFHEAPHAFLVTEVLPDSRDAADSVFESIAVLPGREYVLHGLRPGRLQLRPSVKGWTQAYQAKHGEERALAVGHQATHIERVGASSRITLPIVVDLTTRHRLQLDWPYGAHLGGLALWARSGQRVRRIDFDVDGHVEGRGLESIPQSRRAALRIELRASDEELLISMPAAGADGSGACAIVAVEDLRRAQARVVLERGVRLRGHAAPGAALAWRPESWGSAAIFRVAVGADGVFDVTGLPAGVALRCDQSAYSCSARGPGSLVDVTSAARLR